MARDEFFQTEHRIDPRENRDAAWEHFERLRDPQHGAGLDEYEIIFGGLSELGNSRGLHFPKAVRQSFP